MPRQDGRCWWCGSFADSKEHRTKASQVRRMLEGEEFVWLGSSERRTRINGANAKALKFPRVMCQYCNNTRSQPFDLAYDQFIDLIWKDPEYFRSRSSFDLPQIFGGDVNGGGNLARYYIKNFACRIAEAGFSVPEQMIDFMDGTPGVQGGTLVLYKSFEVFDSLIALGSPGHYPRANQEHEPECAKDGSLRAFAAEIQDGPIGALFWWEQSSFPGLVFSAHSLAYLRSRNELPYIALHVGFGSH